MEGKKWDLQSLTAELPHPGFFFTSHSIFSRALTVGANFPLCSRQNISRGWTKPTHFRPRQMTLDFLIKPSTHWPECDSRKPHVYFVVNNFSWVPYRMPLSFINLPTHISYPGLGWLIQSQEDSHYQGSHGEVRLKADSYQSWPRQEEHS